MRTARTLLSAASESASPAGARAAGGAPGWTGTTKRGSFGGWRQAAVLGIGFFVLAEAGRFLSVRDSTYLSLWLPAGLYVAMLLRAEGRNWPRMVLAAFAGNLAFDLHHGTPVSAGLLFCLANAVQSLSGAWLVRRFVAERPSLRTLGEFLGFIALAAALSPVPSAAIGAATLVAFGWSSSFVQSWTVWWGSNAIAILLLAPFLLTLCSVTSAEIHAHTRPKRLLEAALLAMVSIGTVAYFMLWNRGVMSPNKGWIAYCVIWAGLRFGALGVGAATLLVALPVAFLTTQFHLGLTPEQIAAGGYVLAMQSSLVALALVGWIPAVVVGERDRKMLELGESEMRLKLANRASTFGLWDWDIAGESMYFSPETKRQLGYRDHELPSRRREFLERLHPADLERAVSLLESCLRDPALDYENEFRLRHKDGSYRWIYARGQILRDDAGTPVRMLGCNIDITERKRVEEELRKSLSRLQELSRRLVEVEGEERRHLSRELHDRVGQNLAALRLNLEVIRNQLPEESLRAVEARINDARNLLEATSRHVRDVMAELRPAALDDYGLVAALRAHATDVAKRHGLSIAVDGEDPEPRLPIAVETELFRIAQEALHNAAKHARAERVDIALVAAGGRVTLTVADDGTGFDTTQPRKAGSLGMTTMQERAESVGARLRVESRAGQGTRVVVEVELGAP